MDERNESFSYTYSAKQQEEVKRIRQKYIPPEADKLEQLRRLDESATRPGMIASLAVGIVSALILGVGMCCTMVWTQFFVPGIVIGVVGIAGVCAAYPLYTKMVKRRREQLAPQIMQLSQELMGEPSVPAK